MARMRGSVKKATKSIEEHLSSAIAIHELESYMPTVKKESVTFLTKVGARGRVQINGIIQCIDASITVTLGGMCLIHSIVKGRKIDAGVILHQEIADCAA
ncbi:hypothetical protein PVK06_040182 [Gossypium arboreum]|uniref:Uncharacterized protein n=1 Tax=Gossypium arboreum TaxID=29729 RepID=A0ABR0N4S1_GOSAR|nr:hypothetical protein PVK06_040182 [Gossypium arboreum]